MAKSDLTGLLILIIVIELTLYIFMGSTTPFTSLLQLLTSGSLWGTTSFWLWVTSNWQNVVGIVGVGTIAVGTALATKNDFAIYAGFAAVFFSYISVFMRMYAQLTLEWNAFSTLEGGGLFSILFVAPIVVLYIVTILKFWRGTD